MNQFIHRGCQKIRLFDFGLKSFQNIGVSSRTLRNCLSVHLKCLLFPSRKLAAWPLKMGWASQKEAGSSPNYHSCEGFLLLVSGEGNCKLVNLARCLKHQEGITTTSCGPILPSYKCITLLKSYKWPKINEFDWGYFTLTSGVFGPLLTGEILTHFNPHDWPAGIFGGARVEVVGQKMKSLSRKLLYYIFINL